MPIEAYLLPEGSDESLHFATVEPGDLGIFIDRSLKSGAYIVARCREDDLCGNIHIVQTSVELTELEPDDDMEIQVDLNKENLAQTIHCAVDFKKDILDLDGEKGILILQHEVGFDEYIQGIIKLD
jgi:hypothetical protein